MTHIVAHVFAPLLSGQDTQLAFFGTIRHAPRSDRLNRQDHGRQIFERDEGERFVQHSLRFGALGRGKKKYARQFK